jgi:hypothetical protein
MSAAKILITIKGGRRPLSSATLVAMLARAAAAVEEDEHSRYVRFDAVRYCDCFSAPIPAE